jgi:hypothetical protein
MTDTQERCPHVTLKRQNVGQSHWYKCVVCGQKLRANDWDGKVEVLSTPAPPVQDTAAWQAWWTEIRAHRSDVIPTHFWSLIDNGPQLEGRE